MAQCGTSYLAAPPLASLLQHCKDLVAEDPQDELLPPTKQAEKGGQKAHSDASLVPPASMRAGGGSGAALQIWGAAGPLSLC